MDLLKFLGSEFWNEPHGARIEVSAFLSGGSRRESVSLLFPVSRGWLHSLAHDPIPLSSKSAAWHLWIFLLFWHFCFPLARTLTITLGPPGYSRIIFPSQGPQFTSANTKVLLAHKVIIHRFWGLGCRYLWGNQYFAYHMLKVKF